MTEQERDEMMHRNWVAQMNAMGFDASGYKLDFEHTIRLVEEPQWISVTDRLPESGVTVLAVKELKNGARDICLARCIPDWEYTEYPSGEKKRKPYWVCSGNNNIIYWMTLPEMPTHE